MKLKSFGCSFVFGTDLPNDGRDGPLATPSDRAYPSLIAHKLGLPWSCHARPGAGNFEILQRILAELAGSEPAIYVINWTWIDRFSYIDTARATPRHPYNPMGWASIMPVDEDAVAKCYYKHLHTQLRDKIETLVCIKSAIDQLKNSGCQFIMTWTDALLWETEWHCPPAVSMLQQQIRPYVADFDGGSFLDWSKRRGFEISATLHPLETAHEAAADYIIDGWDSLVQNQ